MEPRLNIVPLGVRKLVKAVAFYRDGLGWRQSSASVGGFAIFGLSTGTALVLYPRCLLAADARIKDHGGFGGTCSIGSLLLWSAACVVSSAATHRKRSAAAGRWPADRPFYDFAEITPAASSPIETRRGQAMSEAHFHSATLPTAGVPKTFLRTDAL